MPVDPDRPVCLRRKPFNRQATLGEKQELIIFKLDFQFRFCRFLDLVRAAGHEMRKKTELEVSAPISRRWARCCTAPITSIDHRYLMITLVFQDQEFIVSFRLAFVFDSMPFFCSPLHAGFIPNISNVFPRINRPFAFQPKRKKN